jgi:hypothetical protein
MAKTDAFAYHLHDMIILLGGKAEIANLLLHPELIDESAVETLRQCNIDLQESLKDRFVGINSTEIATESEGETRNLRYSFHTSLTC